MSLTLAPDPLRVAVGTTLDNVAVLTSDNDEVALPKDVGKGFTDGLPEVSKLVCTMPVVFVITALLTL